MKQSHPLAYRHGAAVPVVSLNRGTPLTRRWLLALAVLLTLAPALSRGAVAAEEDDYAGALNLPAMVLTPADLEAAGFPGYGKFGDGTFVPFASFVATTAAFRGLPVEAVQAASLEAGWRRFYGSTMGVPSVPDAPDCGASQVAFSFVNEYANAAGAGVAFAALGARGAAGQARIAAVAGTSILGDESRIESTVVADPAVGPKTGLSVVFRRDNVIGSAGFEVLGNTPSAPPAAAPGPALVATVATVETLAARLLAKVDATLGAGDPGLPVLALRLDRATVPVVYEREGYRIRDGEAPPFCGGVADDILARPAIFASVEEVYEVEQQLQVGEEPAATNPYYLLRVIRFADEAAAAAFLATYPAMLATGAGSVSGAAPVAGTVLDLGDESLALAYGAGAADGPPAAYEIDVRVGATVVTVYLGSTLRPDLAIVEALARAQVACLDVAVCPPLPVPEALLVTPFAT